MMNKKLGQRATDAGGLDDVIALLSRIRAHVDALNLPPSQPQQDLVFHLALASMAAHQLRLGPDDDDIVIE